MNSIGNQTSPWWQIEIHHQADKVIVSDFNEEKSPQEMTISSCSSSDDEDYLGSGKLGGNKKNPLEMTISSCSSSEDEFTFDSGKMTAYQSDRETNLNCNSPLEEIFDININYQAFNENIHNFFLFEEHLSKEKKHSDRNYVDTNNYDIIANLYLDRFKSALPELLKEENTAILDKMKPSLHFTAFNLSLKNGRDRKISNSALKSFLNDDDQNKFTVYKMLLMEIVFLKAINYKTFVDKSDLDKLSTALTP